MLQLGLFIWRVKTDQWSWVFAVLTVAFSSKRFTLLKRADKNEIKSDSFGKLQDLFVNMCVQSHIFTCVHLKWRSIGNLVNIAVSVIVIWYISCTSLHFFYRHLQLCKYVHVCVCVCVCVCKKESRFQPDSPGLPVISIQASVLILRLKINSSNMSALESDHELHALLGTQAHGHTNLFIDSP